MLSIRKKTQRGRMNKTKAEIFKKIEREKEWVWVHSQISSSIRLATKGVFELTERVAVWSNLLSNPKVIMIQERQKAKQTKETYS